VSVGTGAGVDVDVAVSRSGFSGPVSMSVSGLPVGASGAFLQNPTASGSSTLRITTAQSTPSGNYTLVVIGTGGAAANSTAIVLRVLAPEQIGMTIAPVQNFTPGQAVNVDVYATVANNFDGVSPRVALQTLPAGFTLAATGVLSTGGPTRFSIVANVGTPAGTYPIAFVATKGLLAVASTISVTVLTSGTASSAISSTMTLTPVAAVSGESAGFGLTSAQSSFNLAAGSSASALVTITPRGGYSDTVTLSSASSLVFASSFAQAGPNQFSATITVGSGTAAGTYSVPITATGAIGAATILLTVIVP
jgi:hypothetical protein